MDGGVTPAGARGLQSPTLWGAGVANASVKKFNSQNQWQWRQREFKVGGTKRRNVWGEGPCPVGWCVPLPTGERSLWGGSNFFLLWSRNGIFWWIL